MQELISQLVAKADLSEAQAAKVAEVVRGFLSTKLPEPLRGPVESYLTGQNVDSAVDQAKGLLGKLF
jgi:proline dehydrogenase